MSQHPYPSAYGPGTHWAIDEAWEILDQLPVGMLPDDWRFLLAGQIAGVLMKHGPTPADMRAFGASDAACYHWPEDTSEHKALRAAYIKGAADCGGVKQ